MPYQTDERLKSYLDTNQLTREQMCRAILAVDKRYLDVNPRHPRGGPDGGRDIEARLSDGRTVFGAIGFVNQANDSNEQKKQIRKKFIEDLKSALKIVPKPEGFVFFTNLNLTITEKKNLKTNASKEGISHFEVMDRERMRIALDSPDGFSIRFQYLDIPLSEAEQASFFARWGDDIQSVISSGFQNLHKQLQRILFLQEAQNTLTHFFLVLDFDREYKAEEIEHFRAFCFVYLKEPKHRILALLFGIADRANRFGGRSFAGRQGDLKGIKHGVGGAQWLHMLKAEHLEAYTQQFDEESDIIYSHTGRSGSIGRNELSSLSLTYNNDDIIRILPTLNLRDIDESMFTVFVNESLAKKISKLHVYANEYKLIEFSGSRLSHDKDSADPKIPVEFQADELADPWVCLRPSNASHFSINFSEETPVRFFVPKQVVNSSEGQDP